MGTWKGSEITESSGLACSIKWANKNYAYVHNDEPGPLYVVNLATGNVVGSISISGVTLFDDEAIAIDPKRILWWGDIGDNNEVRDVIAVYTHAEPGPGNHGDKPWTRYLFQYPGGTAHNAEALIIWPNGIKQIVTKEAKGLVCQFPATLRSGSTRNQLRIVAKDSRLDFVTDAVAQHDGRFAFVIRKDKPTTISVFSSHWNYIGSIPMSSMVQPEGLAIDADGKYLWVCNDNGGPGGRYQRVSIPAKYRQKKPSTPSTPTKTKPPTTVVPALNPCQG